LERASVLYRAQVKKKILLRRHPSRAASPSISPAPPVPDPPASPSPRALRPAPPPHVLFAPPDRHRAVARPQDRRPPRSPDQHARASPRLSSPLARRCVAPRLRPSSRRSHRRARGTLAVALRPETAGPRGPPPSPRGHARGTAAIALRPSTAGPPPSALARRAATATARLCHRQTRYAPSLPPCPLTSPSPPQPAAGRLLPLLSLYLKLGRCRGGLDPGGRAAPLPLPRARPVQGRAGSGPSAGGSGNCGIAAARRGGARGGAARRPVDTGAAGKLPSREEAAATSV